jgi:hypothetical protein
VERLRQFPLSTAGGYSAIRISPIQLQRFRQKRFSAAIELSRLTAPMRLVPVL